MALDAVFGCHGLRDVISTISLACLDILTPSRYGSHVEEVAGDVQRRIHPGRPIGVWQCESTGQVCMWLEIARDESPAAIIASTRFRRTLLPRTTSYPTTHPSIPITLARCNLNSLEHLHKAAVRYPDLWKRYMANPSISTIQYIPNHRPRLPLTTLRYDLRLHPHSTESRTCIPRRANHPSLTSPASVRRFHSRRLRLVHLSMPSFRSAADMSPVRINGGNQ